MALKNWLTRKLKSWSWIRGADDTVTSRNIRSPLYIPTRPKDLDNNTIIQSCVRWAIRNFPEPPLEVEKLTKDGWECDPTNPLAAMFRRPLGKVANTKNRMSYRLMMGALISSLMLDGNAYILKLRNASGALIGLKWLSHYWVEPVAMQSDASELDYYRVHGSTGMYRVETEDIIHIIDGLDPMNPVRGCSPLKSAMRLILTDNEIAVYTWSIMKQPHPSVVISPKDGTIQQEDIDALTLSMEKQSAGEKSGGMFGLTAPVQIDKLTVTPEEMAIDKISRLPEERITALFGIAAVVCGLGAGLDHSTYSNFQEARKAAAEDFLVPYWRLIESALDEQLLPDFGMVKDARAHFDEKCVKALQENQDATHARVRGDFVANLIPRDQALRETGREPGPDDAGVYSWMLRPMGMPPGTNPASDAAKAISREIRKEVESGL